MLVEHELTCRKKAGKVPFVLLYRVMYEIQL